MNTKSTRILCGLLVLFIITAMVSGCNKSDKNDSSSSSVSDDVTSVAPPSVIIDNTEGYKVADGTTFVAVFTDTKTNITTMKVATETALSAFKEAVTATEGYSYKIVDTNGNEITDDTAIIVDGYKFMLYKNGETTATKTYTISVVTKEIIESTISEVKAEESRYESQMAEVSSKQASNQTSKQASSQTSSQIFSHPDTASDGHSIVDISSTAASSKVYDLSVLNGYTFDYKTDDTNINTVSNDIYNRFHATVSNIEAKYNMEFNVDPDSGAYTATALINAVMAGEKYADVVVTSLYTAIKEVKAGAIADFKLATNLDLNAQYFNKAISDGLTFKGKTYAVSFTSMGTNPQGVTFNKDLISLYAPDYDIYQMYKDGTWTADAYTEILKLCSKNLDDNPDTNEVYGMTSNTNVIGIALNSFAGNGKDPSTGYIFPTFVTDAGIQSLNWCKDAYNNKYWKYIADIYKAVDFFAAGKAATIVTYMWAVTQATAAAEINVGFVPFPISGNQSNYVTQTYDCQVFVVPDTNRNNMDKVGAVLNELAADNDANVNTQVGNYENAGLDEIGCGVFRWALRSATPDLFGGVFSTTIATTIDTSVTNASKEPASAMSRIADLAIYEVNNYYSDLTGQPKTAEPDPHDIVYPIEPIDPIFGPVC